MIWSSSLSKAKEQYSIVNGKTEKKTILDE